MVILQLRQLNIPPGQRLLIEEVDWQEFENILVELGDRRAARIAYYQGILEMRMPTSEHEVNKELIGDMVKILLEELAIDCECFGSTTFKQQSMASGIEPDQCFYIRHHEQMRGKRRVDLRVDPVPDLAIEIDVTSKTQLDAYATLGVLELWRYESQVLQIYVLKAGQYQSSQISPTFPNLPVIDLISEFVGQGALLGRSQALRTFRSKVREFI